MQRAICGIHLADFINDDDVRVIERGGYAGFLAKASDALSVFGEARRQQLERDLAAQPRVSRQIDLAHSSASDLSYDLVMADRLSVTRLSLRQQRGGHFGGRRLDERLRAPVE